MEFALLAAQRAGFVIIRCMFGMREAIVALEIGIVAIHCGVLAGAATMAAFLVPGIPAS